MFKDLKVYPSSSILEYDICIVGSGPAGISLAKKLFDTNLKIAVLESGGLEPESEYQELNIGENSGPSYLSLDSSRLRCFGGAGKLWAGVCAPFKKDEFYKKSYIYLSGWPISLSSLDPYYKEASEMLGISHEKFYNKSLLGNTFKEKSFYELNKTNTFLTSNVFQISNINHRDLSEKYKSEFKTSRNIDVIFHSTVTEINLTENSKTVQSVSVADLFGNQSTVKSKIFVLACGALENPRILLSSNKLIKNGVGNNHGFVGTCFMSHPGIKDVAEIYKSSSGKCISKDINNNHKVVFEISTNERDKQKILRHSLSISPQKSFENKSSYNLGRVISDGVKLFENTNFLKEIFCRFQKNNRFSPRNWNLDIGLEQPPRLSNNLKLHNDKDRLGIPKINMHWNDISQIEKDTVLKSSTTMARALGVLGIGRIKYKSGLLNGQSFKIDDPINHHIGTTRMSDSPKTGVVDKNCKVFGISNLYIAGSSVFTTSSIVNPTYTIIALSLRLGNYIKSMKL